MNTRHIALSTLLCGLLAFSGNGFAADTDIYLQSRDVPRDDSPNILIIFDNSGSMETADVDVPPTYDGATTYSGSFDASRVYWSTDSNTPASTTDQWFLATDNDCTTSDANLGATTGATGSYSGDYVAGWIWKTTGSTTSTTQGRWNDLLGGTNGDGNAKMGKVDCRQDSPADTSGAYLKDSNNSNLAFSSRYTSTSSDELNWDNIDRPTLYSGNYLNYLENPPATVTITRMQAAQNVVNDLIDSTYGVNLGIMAFNHNNNSRGRDAPPHGGRVIAKIEALTDARRTSLKTLVNSLEGRPDGYSNYTPLAETLWEARLYLGGLAVDFGDDEPTATPAQDTTADDGGDPAKYISPYNYACQQSYIIIVTDGSPTRDDDADDSGRIGGLGLGSLYNSNRLSKLAGWMYDNDLVADVSGVAKTQGIQRAVTYTVGFLTDQTLLENTAAAGNGEYFTATNAEQLRQALQSVVVDILTTTSTFTAPTLSVNAFNTLYNRDEIYFAMFKPASTVWWDGNVKKYFLCRGTEVNSSGDTCTLGSIIDVNNDDAIDPVSLRVADTAKSGWSSSVDGNIISAGGAGAEITTSRTAYTYTGGYDTTDGRTPTGTTDLSAAVNAVSTGNSSLTYTMLGVADNTEKDIVINWMRGKDARDLDDDGSTTDSRWAFADPLHSRPVAITYGGDATTPIIKLLVGTNDGGLRMINEATGEEEWVFVPQEMLKDTSQAIQDTLSNNGYASHIYGLDGRPAVWVQDNNGNGIIEPESTTDTSDPREDKVIVFIGMRRGGSNIYAVDITPNNTLTTTSTSTSRAEIEPDLLWVIRGGTNGTPTTGYEKLGQTWSRPQVVTVNIKSGSGSIAKTVLMFGGGYDASNQDYAAGNTDTLGNSIYMVDADNGERIWWASSDTTADLVLSDMDYSIPSDLALMDTDGDGRKDRIYVGDMGGQILRIDLSPTIAVGSNGDSGEESTGYVFADLGCPEGTRTDCTGTATQDKRKFFYRPNVARVYDSNYSSTARYDLVSIASGDRADPLDKLTFGADPQIDEIHNRIYVLRDFDVDSGPRTTYAATITHATSGSPLYNATGDLLNNDTSSCSETDLTELKAAKGWFVDLVSDPDSTPTATTWVGEKSLARTVIYDGYLYVTTYTPPSSSTAETTCAANEGLGKLYAFSNVLTGPYCSSTDIIDVGGGIPPELSAVFLEEGKSGLVGTKKIDEFCDPATDPNQCTPARDKTYWWEE